MSSSKFSEEEETSCEKCERSCVIYFQEEPSCVICFGPRIPQAVLNCGHTFCRPCIDKFAEDSNLCPI